MSVEWSAKEWYIFENVLYLHTSPLKIELKMKDVKVTSLQFYFAKHKAACIHTQ